MAQYKVPTLSKVKSLLNERGQLGKVIAVLDTPPSNPNQGDKYIVAQNAQGDWSTHDNQIAEYNGSAWEFYTPIEGDFVYVNTNDNYLFYINNNWVEIDSLINSIELLGDDGIFFKKNRFGFNTSVLSSVFNIETEENDVDYFDIRKVTILPSVYEFTGTFNVDNLDWKDVIKVGDYVYYLSYNGSIVKLDLQANVIWAYKYEGMEYYRAILNDGEDLFLFGTDGNTIFYIAKISGSDGSVIWGKKYTCSEKCDLRGAEKDDTHIYTMHLVNNGVAVAKIDLDGNVILFKKYTNSSLGPYEYDDNEILVQPVGDYVAVGYYPHTSTNYIGHVLKLNKADLSIVWAKSYSNSEYMPINTLVWDGTYYVLGSCPKENDLYNNMVVRLNPETGEIVDYGRWAYYDNGNLVSTMMVDVVPIASGYATSTSTYTGVTMVLHLDENLNLLKAYKMTTYKATGVRGYDGKAYLMGRDGYLAFLGEGLEILDEDSNWEDVTSEMQNKTFPFDVSDFSYTTGDISVYLVSNGYSTVSLSLTLTKHAQNSYGGGTSKESIIKLDKDNTLNLAGGLLVSDTTAEEEGLIKYDSTSQDLKGYVSGQWKSLTKQGKYNPADDTVELDVE